MGVKEKVKGSNRDVSTVALLAFLSRTSSLILLTSDKKLVASLKNSLVHVISKQCSYLC